MFGVPEAEPTGGGSELLEGDALLCEEAEEAWSTAGIPGGTPMSCSVALVPALRGTVGLDLLIPFIGDPGGISRSESDS